MLAQQRQPSTQRLADQIGDARPTLVAEADRRGPWSDELKERAWQWWIQAGLRRSCNSKHLRISREGHDQVLKHEWTRAGDRRKLLTWLNAADNFAPEDTQP